MVQKEGRPSGLPEQDNRARRSGKSDRNKRAVLSKFIVLSLVIADIGKEPKTRHEDIAKLDRDKNLSLLQTKKKKAMLTVELTVELLRRSVTEWNKARRDNPEVKVNRWADFIKADLRGVNLNGADLREANLKWVDLSGANLSGANLSGANLSGANLSGATFDGPNLRGEGISKADLVGVNLCESNLSRVGLSMANLSMANLSGANLSEAGLIMANLMKAKLVGANLSKAGLNGANLSGAYLSGADLDRADFFHTILGDIDLSYVKNLDTVRHTGPSTIGIDTLYNSQGNIPEAFLRGCGVPDIYIEYAHSLTSKAIEFYSCFISHSTADKAFADRLYADLQAKGVRCWYAPHDMMGGKKIHDQIGEAIRQHEKLLLILSESSINSEWVKQEITKAKKREDTEGKRVLFPISLIEYSKIQEWEFPDSKGRDLAEEIMLYYIPSFIGWEKDNDTYTTEFEKLLNSFHAERNTEGKV